MPASQGLELPKWIRIEEIQGEQRVVLKTTQAANFFNIANRTLQRYHKQGCPKYKRGWWDIKEVRKWLNQEAQDDKLESRKLKAEVEYREAKAERERKLLDIEEGDYMEKEEVKKEWVRRIIEIKNGLLALSRKVAGQIPDSETRALVEGVIEDEVYDLLEQFARRGKYTPTPRS